MSVSERIIFVVAFTAILPAIFLVTISFQYGDIIAETIFPYLISGSIISLSFIGSVIGSFGESNEDSIIIGCFSGIIITIAYVTILESYQWDYGVFEILITMFVPIVGAIISPIE
tara:strand:+ start:448 stop:792 length:345 start_codon:yes stop_codon:yes gene_type:complete